MILKLEFYLREGANIFTVVTDHKDYQALFSKSLMEWSSRLLKIRLSLTDLNFNAI